jgi:hypothetical protein
MPTSGRVFSLASAAIWYPAAGAVVDTPKARSLSEDEIVAYRATMSGAHRGDQAGLHTSDRRPGRRGHP